MKTEVYEATDKSSKYLALDNGEEVYFQVAIIMVTFCNPNDVVASLRSLAQAHSKPSFEIFISENGGSAAMDELVSVLTGPNGCCNCVRDLAPASDVPDMVRRAQLRLIDRSRSQVARVHVGQMRDNLGYAGGINAWLRQLLQMPGWGAVWILNPDTQVMPSALAELAQHSVRYAKGMVGSRLIGPKYPDRVHSRGLRWRKLMADTLAVDYLSPIDPAPNPEDTNRRIDAPAGASCYVTRNLIEQIGLMDENYFLYYEDLEWGCRAQAFGGVGYAHSSIVLHEGGTTIGTTSSTRANRSPLSVYLEFRNRILFVRNHHRRWLVWTILMQFVHAATFGAAGAFVNLRFAFLGLLAGILGETGRPYRMSTLSRR